MAPNPSESEGLQLLKRDKGGALGGNFVSKSGLPVINIPGCPAHPDWVTQILVAVASGRGADLTLDEFHRPKTFFSSFTQTGCTRNAILARKLGQLVESLQSLPRHHYGLFMIDFTHQNYASSPHYDKAVKRYSPFTETSYEAGVSISGRLVEIYALLGGQWPHSSYMVPGGVMCSPTLTDVTRSISILEHFCRDWIEPLWFACSIHFERWRPTSGAKKSLSAAGNSRRTAKMKCVVRSACTTWCTSAGVIYRGSICRQSHGGGAGCGESNQSVFNA